MSNRTLHDQIWVMNSDGTNPINLTNDPSLEDGQPAWSPDGTRIAFVRGVGTGGIFVMNADGTSPTRLTTAPTGTSDVSPSWSPDGARLTFTRGGDIFIMNVNGSGLQALTSNGAALTNQGPSWSHDGTKIAFQGRDQTIFVMNADGSSPVSLLVYGSEPAWKP